MSGDLHFNLAHEIPFDWDSSEEGTPPEQYPRRDASRRDDDPESMPGSSVLSNARNREATLQLRISRLETLIEEQNSGIPALQDVPTASTQGKSIPRLMGIADSQLETYDNDGNDIPTVADQRQRTEPEHGEANNHIEATERVLRYCFGLDSDPKFEHKEVLAIGLNLGVGYVDDWYRKHRLAQAENIPYIRVSDSVQDLQIEENEELLDYCFRRDPDLLLEDKDKLAKILRIAIGNIDDWHREKRLALRASSLSNSSLNKQSESAQSNRTSDRHVSQGMYGKEQLNDPDKGNGSGLQSIVSTSNSSSLPRRRPGLETRSESSQTTAASNSNQRKTGRYKCTFPGCSTFSSSVAGQARHEYEVHWREEYFPCLLCSIICTNDGCFECCFCGLLFRELKAIEEHIISPCDLPSVVKASRHRYVHAVAHQNKRHPPTSESKADGMNYLKCYFCSRTFDQNEDPKHHVCGKKAAWKTQQELKTLFEAESTIWSEKGLRGWTFRIEGGYPVPWPPKCSFPTCLESFDNLIERAVHFDKEHFVPSLTELTVLKRGFSDSGIEYAGEDDHMTQTESTPHDTQSQNGSTVGRRSRRRRLSYQQIQLSDEVRMRMDLVGVGERQPTKPP